jgi:hypothetical protein
MSEEPAEQQDYVHTDAATAEEAAVMEADSMAGTTNETAEASTAGTAEDAPTEGVEAQPE